MPQKKVKYKVCQDCPERGLQPISHFYVKEKRKTATRYFSRCKWCYYKWVYGRDKKAGYRWHGTGQKHYHVRLRLRQAVKKGIVIKPDCCDECGEKTRSRDLDGHHDDYRKPLKVRWLCPKCHRAADST